MRIDLLLWCLRLYKSRSMASNACKKGHIRLNDKILKPSRDILTQDIISVRKNKINYRIKILDIPKSRVGAKIIDIYRQDLTEGDAHKNIEKQNLAKTTQRSKGLGRPTKKDRREIDEFKKDKK